MIGNRKREAIQRASAAAATVYDIPPLLVLLPRTLRTVADYERYESRARKAVELYPHSHGGRVLFMDGWNAEQIASEFFIRSAEECTCNGLGDACRVCRCKADPEAELPFDQQGD